MDVTLSYGKTGLPVRLPDSAPVRVVEPAFESALADQRAAVTEGLGSPVGSAALAELVKPSDRVGIVFSDITRPTPYHIILPALLDALGHVRRENIVLFNATGTHRANSDQELERMLGPGIVGRYRIVQNDCEDDASHRYAGTTRGGNDVCLLDEFLRCDVKIPTGFIEPHFFAGFSGGGKAIMPGLAGLETIQRNHSAFHMDHPRVRWGITQGNPLWEEVTEAAGFADPTFLLNVALNRQQEITAVFAGDFHEAHRAGCDYVKAHAMAAVGERFDIVVTSNSGYPLDLNMYQAVKGMSAAFQIVKPGGHIIVAADCWDGIPDHGQYGALLSSASGPAELLASIRSPGFAMQDMWQAQIHALICDQVTVHFHSHNLSDSQIEQAFMKPCPDVSRRVAELAEQIGGQSTICVLPDGPQTIPYIA